MVRKLFVLSLVVCVLCSSVVTHSYAGQIGAQEMSQSEMVAMETMDAEADVNSIEAGGDDARMLLALIIIFGAGAIAAGWTITY